MDTTAKGVRAYREWINLLMTPEEAEYISRHLVPAVTTARMQIRYPQKI
jgi:hypothetical protein